MRCSALSIACVALCACLVIASTVSFAVAQTEGNPFRKGESTGSVNEVRASDADNPAPSNDQQLRLAEELRLLKHAESRMGAKHPGIHEIRNKIANVTEQLEALAAITFQQSNQTKPTQSPLIPGEKDQQLRQIIQQMLLKIERLETRVETLERQRMIH